MNRRSTSISPSDYRPFLSSGVNAVASLVASTIRSAAGANRYFGYFYFFFFYAFAAAGGLSM